MTKKENDYVKKINSERKIISQFLIKDKIIKYSKNNAPYLQVTLQDKTGQIIGRMFKNKARAEHDKIETNTVYNIVGKIQEFPSNSGKYNILIDIINPTRNYDEKEFILQLKNREKHEKYLHDTINNIKNTELKEILKKIFNDKEIYGKFITAPAAKKHHHNYLGGLLEHTNEVIAICKSLKDIYEEIDEDLLITGAILHDIGKIYTYNYTYTEIEINYEGTMLDHIFLGSNLVKEKMNTLNISSKTKIDLLHLILSHHGELSLGWGSTVDPKKVEAIALHHADDMSAKINKSLQ